MSLPIVTIGDSYLPLLDGTIRDRFVLCEGPRGTSKTRSILSIVVARALRNPGSRWLLCRSTRTRLTESVLVTLEQQVFPAFGMEVPGGAGRENRHDYQLPNGSVLVTMGLDDPQRGQSAEYAGIYPAEVVELDRAEEITALAGTLRQAIQPGWEPNFIHQCLMDCNPGPPGHFANQMAEPVPKEYRRVSTISDYQRLLDHARRPAPPGKWKRIVTRHQDNPYYFDVKKWEWTEPGRQYLETLGFLTGHLRRRWLDGDWVSAEGTVFPEFDDTRHVITPFEIPEDWPIYLWWDPGYDHPTAIVWVAMAPNGCMYVIDEIYQGGKAVSEHCRAVSAHNAGRTVRTYYGDPHHITSKTAQSPMSIAAQARLCGITLVPGPQDQSEAMVNRVRERLITGMLKVFANCQNTIREFQSWSYKRTSKGELPTGDDQFEDRDNHCLAADTLVWTTQGMIPIAELVGLEAVAITPYGCRILHNVRETKTDTVYRWFFANGAVLRATRDHEIQTMRGEWVRLDELRGEQVPCCRSEGYHPKDSGIRRPPVLSRRAVLSQGDQTIPVFAPASGGMGMPPWIDPYRLSRSPHRRGPVEQRDFQSEADGSQRASSWAHDPREAGMVREECSPEGNAGLENLAREPGGATVAQPTQLVDWQKEGVEAVFDLTVGDYHCFIVNQGIVVKNCMDGIKGLCSAGLSGQSVKVVGPGAPKPKQPDRPGMVKVVGRWRG